MRVNQTTVLRYRAAFGLGFIVLGVVTLWRVATAAAPPQSKLIGAALAIVLIALGVVRVRQYARARRGAGP